MKSYLSIIFIISVQFVCAQEFKPNYNESKIPDYTLPQILKAKNGSEITTAEQWQQTRRREVLTRFEAYMYGRVPEGEVNVDFKLTKELDALGGKATMKEVRMNFSRGEKQHFVDLLIYLPKSDKKVPVFLGLNFYGNQTIFDDPNITLSSGWTVNNEKFHITEHKATEESRGVRYNRWPIEMILDRGYGIATMHRGDIDPDKNDFSDGVHPLFYEDGQTHPAKNEWGSVAAWAWGLSRAMDYFEEDDAIDESKVAVMGHSRLGKTSLWAGATDERFAIVISNDSGCGGAALSRRQMGETVWRINTSFPHWFNDNFNEFNNNENALPIDQHMLIALAAPRPVYVASAEDDRWADPKGEFLSAYYAGEVYSLFGLKGLPSEKMPAVNKPIHNSVGYHIRSGGHDVKDFDWESWMDFADKHYGK